jgi:hypothetical protein
MTDTSIDETSPLIYHHRRLSDTSDEQTISQQRISVWLILLSAGFERLAFYSLAGNLVLFLTSGNIHWSITHSILVSFIFLGKNNLNRKSFFIYHLSFPRYKLFIRTFFCLVE